MSAQLPMYVWHRCPCMAPLPVHGTAAHAWHRCPCMATHVWHRCPCMATLPMAPLAKCARHRRPRHRWPGTAALKKKQQRRTGLQHTDCGAASAAHPSIVQSRVSPIYIIYNNLYMWFYIHGCVHFCRRAPTVPTPVLRSNCISREREREGRCYFSIPETMTTDK